VRRKRPRGFKKSPLNPLYLFRPAALQVRDVCAENGALARKFFLQYPPRLWGADIYRFV
jgi:hypothetical protein